MLSALCWVPGKFAKSVPSHYEPTEEELKDMEDAKIVQDAMEDDDMEQDTSSKKNDDDEKMEDSNKENESDEDIDDDDDNEDINKIYKLDDYDEENDDVQLGESSLMYYKSNEEDEFMENKDDEELSEAEDFIIKQTDALLMCAHSEDDISHLDVCIYEEEHDNLYVHHDIMLPTFPLCISWLDYDSSKQSDKGNFLAIGTFLPGIEIWDLDVVDSMEPLVTLGGYEEQQKGHQQKGSKKKNRKLGKLKPKLKSGSHSNSVLGLSWNKFGRNILASCSADETIKLWDLSTQACVQTFQHHKDKVQAISWHPAEEAILLSGSYDKTTAVMDVRYPKSANFWKIPSDVECVQWNAHSPNFFFVSMEDGQVMCFDIRKNEKDPIWTLAAHTKAVSGFSYNSKIPNLMATGSTDKLVKVWNISDNKPKNIYTFKPNIPIFNLSWYTESPFLLAAGGKGTSEHALGGEVEDRLKIWNTMNIPEISSVFSSQ